MLTRNSAFEAFVITNAIALILSLSSVFVHFTMTLETLHKGLFLFYYGFWFTIVAMGGMVAAFVAGTFAVVAPCLWFSISICFIGLRFFLSVAHD